MSEKIYRVKHVELSDHWAIRFTVEIEPASADAESKPEVGDYLVLHEDNGPPEA